MREIKNNLNIGKAPKVDLKTSNAETSNQDVNATTTESPNVQDFSNPRAETLGRSQVNKSDSLDVDIAFGLTHPKSIASADKFFNIAYTSLVSKNDPAAYEKAATMTDIFVRKERFVNKD